MADEELDVKLTQEDCGLLIKLVSVGDWGHSEKYVEDNTIKGVRYKRQECFSLEDGDLSVKLFMTDKHNAHNKLDFNHGAYDGSLYEAEIRIPGRIVCESNDFVMSIYRGVHLQHNYTPDKDPSPLEVIDGDKD